MRGLASSTKSAAREVSVASGMAAGWLLIARRSGRDGPTPSGAQPPAASRRPALRSGSTAAVRRAVSDRTRVAPSRSAPVATCAVASRKSFPERTVRPPSAIWARTRRGSAKAAHRRPARPDRPARTAQIPAEVATARARTRCAKWIPTAKDAIGGRSLPKASGKSGIARPALVWRMTAPTTSCRKTSETVATAARPTRFDPAGAASLQRGEVTTARATVSPKNVCARHACATEIGVGRRNRTVRPPRIPCATTAARATQPSRRTEARGSRRASHAARTTVASPTAEATRRCVCSKRMPPTHFEGGNVNGFCP